ncbi:MAG: molecular chaperone HtpG [Gammaproteobacteria bacterium]
MVLEAKKETLGFQSEVRQLLDLVVHSLYGNREIFLRELISNAADAADKLRYLAIADEKLLEGDAELKIEVDVSKTLKTITIRDNGIGMSRQEVIDHIGTIARSGTREFFKTLTGDQKHDSQLIGQFGVGFYSAFIVAERVTLVTRRAGLAEDDGVRWESDGLGEYTIETARKKARGTEIILHLREDALEFLEIHRLRGIIKRYSDHIALPISLPREEASGGWETVNSARALWARAKSEIKPEEYQEFYKDLAHDFQEPLAWTHNKVEGKLEYTTLFYIPAHAPFDLWDPAARRDLKLYIRRVLIMDATEELLPRYLRFVRGVVDSNDLPLNVSREILQQTKAVDTIRAASTKRVLGLLEEMAAERAGDYAKFWSAFGRVLKEGIVEDPDNRERVAKLLRFSSTREDRREADVTLADYVGRMQDGQKYIFYIVAENFETARASPHLEVFRARGIEVLLLSDPIDEWLVDHLRQFDGRDLRSVARGDLDLGEPADKAAGEAVADAAVAARVKAALGDAVKDVRMSRRLTTSPACLVADEHDMGSNMQRILKAAGHEVPAGQPILELNPNHPMIARVGAADEEHFADWARLLLEQAQMSEGGRPADPAEFVQRMNRLFLHLMQ